MDFALQALQFGEITNAVIDDANVIDQGLPGDLAQQQHHNLWDISSEGQKGLREEMIAVAETHAAGR
jgi:hypothetical protein